MPFRIQEYGASYALLQLPAVKEMVTSQQWGEFAAKVVTSHARMEELRQHYDDRVCLMSVLNHCIRRLMQDHVLYIRHYQLHKTSCIRQAGDAQ
jgi:hypothetical protein